MSISKDKRDEIRCRYATLKFKEADARSEEIAFLLGCIPELLKDSEESQHLFHVEPVPHSDKQQRLYADTDEMADLFVSMCRTYGTVTWKLIQDCKRTGQPGQGVYMLSESLPEELRPQGRMPCALPKTEPDGPEQRHV
jgi:hypothetical protein